MFVFMSSLFLVVSTPSLFSINTWGILNPFFNLPISLPIYLFLVSHWPPSVGRPISSDHAHGRHGSANEKPLFINFPCFHTTSLRCLQWRFSRILLLLAVVPLCSVFDPALALSMPWRLTIVCIVMDGCMSVSLTWPLTVCLQSKIGYFVEASVTPLSLLSRSNRKKKRSSTHILNPSRKLYSAVNVLAVPSMYTLALGQSVSPLLKRLTFMVLLVCVSVALSRSLSRLLLAPVHPFNSAQSTFTVVHPHNFITYCSHYITPLLLLRIKCTNNDRVWHPEEKERCSCYWQRNKKKKRWA